MSNNSVILENGLFRREIAVSLDGLRTISMVNKATRRELVKRQDVAEFQLTLDDTVVASYSKPEAHVLDGNVRDHGRPLQLEGVETKATPSGGEIAMVSFLCPAFLARIKVCYEIHPDLSVFRSNRPPNPG